MRAVKDCSHSRDLLTGLGSPIWVSLGKGLVNIGRVGFKLEDATLIPINISPISWCVGNEHYESLQTCPVEGECDPLQAEISEIGYSPLNLDTHTLLSIETHAIPRDAGSVLDVGDGPHMNEQLKMTLSWTYAVLKDSNPNGITVNWSRRTVLGSPPVGCIDTFYKDPLMLCTWQSQLAPWEREKLNKGAKYVSILQGGKASGNHLASEHITSMYW